MRLSKTQIERLPLPVKGTAKQIFYRDSALPGFALRITPNGARSFIVEKKIKGKVRRLTIGKYGQIPVEEARKEALMLISDMTKGIDPRQTRIAEKLDNVTLRECYADYIDVRKNLSPATLHDYGRSIDGALKDWRSTPLLNINKRMILQRHKKLGDKSHARANNTMRLLRALFNFAMYQYEKEDGSPLISINPVKHISDCRGWYRVDRRQTWIKPHQLADWYDATMQLVNTNTRDYLHFMLMTGLRRSEASKLSWDMVDIKDRSFIIPETKNHQAHTLPLSDYLCELLNNKYAVRENDFVFPGKTDRGYLVEPRAAIVKVTNLSGVEFTLHDLRRTFITIAESLDIPAYALKRLLNHKMANDVTAGYIVPNVERLRDPMQRITEYFLRAFEPKQNITQISVAMLNQ